MLYQNQQVSNQTKVFIAINFKSDYQTYIIPLSAVIKLLDRAIYI